MGFWLNVAFLGFGGGAALALQSGVAMPTVNYPFLLATWQPMAASDWGMIAVLALLMVGVAIGVATAYQSPQPAVIATLEYCYMIFAIFWGYVLFGETPDFWIIAGMVLITAGGCAVLLPREQAAQRG